MIRRYVVLVLAFASLGWISPAMANKPTAAVMPLGMGAGGEEFRGLGRSLADMMVTDFSQSNALQLVERMQLSMILDELKLAKSGYLDKSTAQKLGKGLGAEYVITGSFSIVTGQFSIDCRIFNVATGTILKSAHSTGPLKDFVAVEKDVVERMLSGLSIKLSLGARRKMLLAAPTENVRALASYGRGVLAVEAAKPKTAKEAFEEALKQDPEFAKASLALAALASTIEAARVSDRQYRANEIEKVRRAALVSIPSELTRSKNFKDTSQTRMDFGIRQHLLTIEGRYCQRYDELKHYLLRNKGDLTPWYAGLSRPGRSSWEVGEAIIGARGVQLGLLTTARGHSVGALMRNASLPLASGKGLLLWASLAAEHSKLLNSLANCHAPGQQISEFDSIIRIAKKWDWFDKPLFTVVGSGPSTLTPRDSADLYWAYLRAMYRGVDRKVHAQADAVLARHPQGDPGRYAVVSRIRTIVSAGKKYEKSKAARFGDVSATLLKKAKIAIKGDSSKLWMNKGLCSEFLSRSKEKIQSASTAYKKHSPGKTRRLAQKRDILDRLGMALGPLMYGNCFRSQHKRPTSSTQLLAMVRSGLKRPHPAKLQDKRCLRNIQNAREELAKPLQPSELYSLIKDYHELHANRCLLVR